ncbi:cell surface protein [Clostridium haemolyticum]|uniref:NEAT domain-containing protein n=1 Tax=Clostridium haemolyticum TaxID=84025 RepID=UPI0009CB0EE4|nr:NEAT domain-containing protein [Clostridium haemolyticum]OOB76361.1 cell surface protein [Clostridium haemolyticum]
MRKNLLKVLTVGILAGGVLFSSSQAFAQTGNVNQSIKLESGSMLAKNDFLKDGTYKVSIQVFKEKGNDLSMAGQYIGQQITLQVKGGQIYAIVDISRLDWMKNINIFVNGADTKYDKSMNGSQKGNVKFKLPSMDAKITFKMNVVPMGNARVAFRVVPQNDIKPTSEASTINNTSNKESKKSDSKETSATSNKETKKDRKKLPQTGLPITQAELPLLGGLTSMAGLFLLKKKNK